MVEARAGAIAAADPRVRIKMCARVLLALAAATALTPPASAQGAVMGLPFRASGAMGGAIRWSEDCCLTRSAGEDPSTRPDLGIGIDDVSLKGRALTVIVHSLGSAAAPGSMLFLEDSSGRTVASTKIAALAAPTDLMPKRRGCASRYRRASRSKRCGCGWRWPMAAARSPCATMCFRSPG